MEKKIILPIAVFIAGLCSIIYELLISTTATYFMGDGVRQFSFIIGVYLFSMGIGAYLSKFFKNQSLLFFIRIEYALGFIGGISVPLLYFLFVNVGTTTLQLLILLTVFIIGLLTGMEVPLLTFASNKTDFKNNLSNVLSLDYIGGLIATLLFPFILLPFVGLYYSSILFGIVNILLGLFLNLIYFKNKKGNFLLGFASLSILIILVVFGGKLLNTWDEKIYKHPIVLNIQSPYQKIVLTKKQEDVRLYLNRVIQFSSADEHRYHESLVHIPFALRQDAKKILILGGGENLASREVLKHDIERIDVVDIDSTMFHLAKTNPFITTINKNAALHPKVNLIAEDAFTFLFTSEEKYDIIIADLPDPTTEAIARLYSKQFFLMAKRVLHENGVFVTQSGEIYFSNTVFSCINRTLKKVFANVETYHTYIPSFGDWGFTIATNEPFISEKINIDNQNLQYLSTEQARNSFDMPKDIAIATTKINTLDNPIILDYYLKDWNKWKSDFTTNTK